MHSRWDVIIGLCSMWLAAAVACRQTMLIFMGKRHEEGVDRML